MNGIKQSILVSVLLALCPFYLKSMERVPLFHVTKVRNDSQKPVIFRVEHGAKVIVTKSIDPGNTLVVDAPVPQTSPVKFIIMGRRPVVWTLKTIGGTKFAWEKDNVEVGERRPYESSIGFRITPEETVAIVPTEEAAAKPAVAEKGVAMPLPPVPAPIKEAAPAVPAAPAIPAPIKQVAPVALALKREEAAAAVPAPKTTEGRLIRVYAMSDLPEAITLAKQLQEQYKASPAKIHLDHVVKALEDAKYQTKEHAAYFLLVTARIHLAQFRDVTKDIKGTSKLWDLLLDIAEDYKEHAEREEKAKSKA